MTMLYAREAGNASAINWTTEAAGGDPVAWEDMLETDSLEANNYAVVLDVASFTRALITTANGGSFTVNLAAVGNREFTCAITAGTTTCLAMSGATYTLRINGTATGSAGTASKRGVYNSSQALVTINGDCVGGGASGTYGYYQDYAGTGGGGTILGECRPGTNSSSYGAYNESNAPMTIYDAAGHATYTGAAGVSAYRAGGRSSILIVKGTLDWTKAGAPINTPFRVERSAKFKILGPDGVTPIYFRPEVGQHFGGNIARVN